MSLSMTGYGATHDLLDRKTQNFNHCQCPIFSLTLKLLEWLNLHIILLERTTQKKIFIAVY